MSRCFPYPPPGYERKGARHQPWIESIKLQREREKTKTEKRKEKREKKDKKRQRKDDLSAKFLPKGRDDEAEQLERSDLTEEFEQPTCYLSDSTQGGNKKRKNNSPTECSENKRNIIRIRLPLRKQTQPEIAASNSTSGREDVHPNQKKSLNYYGQEQSHSINTKANAINREVVPLQNSRESQVTPSNQRLSSKCGNQNDILNDSGKKQSHSINTKANAVDREVVPLRKHREPESLPGNQRFCSTSGRGPFLHHPKEILHYSGQEQSQSINTKVNTIDWEVVPVRKRKEPEVAPSNEKLFSTSGREDFLSHSKEILHGQELRHPSNAKENPKERVVGLMPIKKQLSNSEMDSSHYSAKTSASKMMLENKNVKAIALYQDPVKDWVPIPLTRLEQNDYDDQEWLFGSKPNRKQDHTSKQNKKQDYTKFDGCEDVSSNRCPTLWPRARFLPEVDIYALPFTVPF